MDPHGHSEQRLAPLWASVYAAVVVPHALKIFLLHALLPLAAVVVIVFTGALTVSDPKPADFFVRTSATDADELRRAVQLAFPFREGRSDRTNRIDSFRQLTVLSRARRSDSPDLATIAHSRPAHNLLTAEAFERHKLAEEVFINHPRYPSFCHRSLLDHDCDSNLRPCALPLSFLNHPALYGRYQGDRLCDRRANIQNFSAFIADVFPNPPPGYAAFFNTNASIAHTWALGSVIRIGLPSLDNQSTSEQLSNWTAARVRAAEALSVPRAEIQATSPALLSQKTGAIALSDVRFALASLVLVLVCIWLHTGSALLAAFGMLLIVDALPLAYLVYHFALRQLYFGPLQLMAVFLVLGIGADDLFVFTDAWKQSAVALGASSDPTNRLSWCVARAARAVSVTSFTTAAAFLITTNSPVMPISTLGLWAGLLIVFLYLNVILTFPAAMILSHRVERFFTVGKVEQSDSDSGGSRLLALARQFFFPSWFRSNPEKPRLVERIFHGPVFHVVSNPFSGGILIVLAAVFVGGSVQRATRIPSPNEQERLLPKSHPVQERIEILSEAFPKPNGVGNIQAILSFGALRRNVSRFERDLVGIPVMDKSFSLREKRQQWDVASYCKGIVDRNETLHIFISPDGLPVVECWMRDYLDWRNSSGLEQFQTYGTDREFAQVIKRFAQHKKSDGSQPYLKYLRNQNIILSKNQSRVVYTELRVLTNVTQFAGLNAVNDVYKAWTAVLEDIKRRRDSTFFEDIAFGMAFRIGGNLSGGIGWKWMETLQKLLWSMLSGLILMLIVSFLLFLVTTRRLKIAVLATGSILGVIVMMLGLMQLIGMELGVSETISVVIASGYSFDGIVHIAFAYVESQEESRVEKVRQALTDLGISVLFGGLTTSVAAATLFAGTITFFDKFAILVLFTVLLSTIWSLIFFPALLCRFGPDS